ncbi:DUF1616 domain-containing protein [Chloroflexota bacterium]
MVFKVRAKQSGGGGVWSKVLSGILALAILVAVGALVYVIASPDAGSEATEFYLLGLGGGADGYPGQLKAGEEGRVVVGIVNMESETAIYRLEVMINGAVTTELEPLTLEHGEKWEEIVGFTPGRVFDGQKVEFLLYKQGQSEVYRRLHLWVDVQ